MFSIFRNKNPEAGSVAELLPLALPLIVNQATDTALLFTDRYFLAGSSADEMNAALGAGLTAFLMGTFFFGILNQINALSGQYMGAKRPFYAAVSASQGFFLSLIFIPILLMSLPFAEDIFSLAGHSGSLLEKEVAYFQILTVGHIFTLMRTVLASFFCGIGKSAIVMKASFFGVFINVPLSYAWVNGLWGLPKAGIVGAAWSTNISNALVMCILAFVYFSPKINAFYRTRKSLLIHKSTMRKLLRIGLPSGFEFFALLSGFNAFVLFFQSAGDLTASAVTVTFSFELLAFLPMTGIQIAVTSLAGKYMGAEKPELARKTAWSGMRIAATYAFSMALIFFIFANHLTEFFTRGQNPEAAAMAATMLRIACLYIPCDTAHLVFGGLLKGAGDVVWTSVISSIFFWGIAALCWVQVNVWGTDPYTIWGSFAAMVVVMSIMYWHRFLQGNWQSLRILK